MQTLATLSRRTFSSLKIRNYRLFVLGQAVSLCGTWMQTIAQAWLVLKLTGSGTALGLVAGLQFLPILLLGPWGGIIADRFPKRRILIFTQSALAIAALSLGILVATGSVRLWMVYVFALALGLITTIDNPTRHTFVMEMVGKDELRNAITLNAVGYNVARAVGPAVAGIVIAALGLALCFIINSLSFVAVIIGLAMMRPQELLPTVRIQRVKGQLREGWRYVKSTPVLHNILIMMVIVGTLSYEFNVILPLIAQFTFHGSAGTYAALTTAMGLGAIAGGLLTANRRQTQPRLLIGAALVFGIAMLLVAAAPSLPLALVGMLFIGACSINFTSLGNVTLQLNSDPAMSGRVMALWTMAFLGSTPIGGPIIGWVGQHAGPRWGMGVGGLAAVAAAVFGAIVLKNIPKKLDSTKKWAP